METRTIINLFHILIIAPLAIYIGYKGYKQEPVPKFWDLLLFVIAIFGFMYHFFRMINPQQPVVINSFRIVNILHMIVFVPIAVFITYNQYFEQEVPQVLYIILILLGVWALLYNAYSLFRSSNINSFSK
jgi:hypothetical protein